MKRYIFQRIGYMIITFFIIMTISFVTMKLLPGSPFKNQDKLTDQQLEIIMEHYRLNDPIPIQFFHYVVDFFKGDLGMSFQFKNQAVTDIILDRIQPSAILGLEALLIGVIFGLILGIFSGLKHNTFWDYGTTTLSVIGISVPSFVFAGFMQYFLAVKLGWLPVAYWEGWKYHIMPALSLSFVVISTIARYIRMEMLEVLGQDYMKTAKAKGLPNKTIIIKHGLKNTLIPVITILGPLAISILTGSLVIEKIFAIPGIGEQFVVSITTNDYPMIMGLTLLYAAFFIIIVFVIDLLYGIVDPRIKLGGENN
ncbi:ABC transporter permease [Pseudogracilibacillus auburnensis]|uniref:Oligopeptide transport system permease protein n=1 Tax=Pseudogracilibacillus auburnensis TaxID=1494959 RepID=A0A2V3VRJ0_9BACI|nr:ABC transporter permease [Pseudogracilibacillus auburnensis]MBO1002513.1 ABC transporter permease [Pseudogracilibacillus auburnensis]PXW82645.1 oligopeptide transport system permease protein [Pseudogracilibacillus auburnensis]